MPGDGFALAVEQWCRQAKDRSEIAFHQIALDMLARVKELTPVQTGFLRANWVALLNDDAEPRLEGAQQADGSWSVDATFQVVARARVGDVIHITNPVRYARRVEFGFVGTDSLGRHYDQKGRGMVAQTMAEAPQIAKAALEKVMKR